MPVRHRKGVCTSFSRTDDEIRAVKMEKELKRTKNELEEMKAQIAELMASKTVRTRKKSTGSEE